MVFRDLFFFLLLLLSERDCIDGNETPSIVSTTNRRITQAQADQSPLSAIEELETALGHVDTGKTIILTKGTFKLSKSLFIDKPNVHLVGASSNKTILSCPEDDSILTIRARNVTVSSMTLEGCRNHAAVVISDVSSDASGTGIVFEKTIFRDNSNKNVYALGGALYVEGCLFEECDDMVLDVTVRDSVFEENLSPVGGAIYGEGCALKVIGSNFTNNHAMSNGGAIYVTGAGTELEILDCQFVENTVTEDEGIQRIVYQEGGLLIERSRYFTFQSPANGGGAIAAISAANLNVAHSEFRSNRATSGGAIHASLDAMELMGRQSGISVIIEDCHFQENRAAFDTESKLDNVDNNLGGAIYFASATAALTKFDILRSSFSSNHANSSGGALHIVTVLQNRLTLDGCTFEENWAGQAGGAAVLRNSGEIYLFRTTWIKNSAADLGGAILLTNSAQLTAKPTLDAGKEVPDKQNLFEQNSAANGGALMCAGCGILLLKNAHFTNNQATKAGGGLYVLDSSHDVRLEQCSFRDNAAVHGGGAAFRAASSVSFASAKNNWWNEFVNNTAVSGGGVFVEANRQKENTFQMKHSRFVENRAISPKDIESVLYTGGVLRLFSDIKEMDENETSSSLCGNGGGGGMCLALDEIPDEAVADVNFFGVEFKKNSALVGGGLFASISGTWSDEKKIDCKSSDLDIKPCRLFHLMKMTFEGNEARYWGGGLFVTNPEMAIVGCGQKYSAMKHWIPLKQAKKESPPLIDCFRFKENRIQESDKEHEQDMASRAYALVITDPPSGHIDGLNGGDRLLPPCKNGETCKDDREDGIKIEVRDAFNHTITGGISDAYLSVFAVSNDILRKQSYQAKNGVVNVNETRGVGIDKESVVQFVHHDFRGQRLQVNLTFTTRKCKANEEKTDIGCKAQLASSDRASAQGTMRNLPI